MCQFLYILLSGFWVVLNIGGNGGQSSKSQYDLASVFNTRLRLKGHTCRGQFTCSTMWRRNWPLIPCTKTRHKVVTPSLGIVIQYSCSKTTLLPIDLFLFFWPTRRPNEALPKQAGTVCTEKIAHFVLASVTCSLRGAKPWEFKFSLERFNICGQVIENRWSTLSGQRDSTRCFFIFDVCSCRG